MDEIAMIQDELYFRKGIKSASLESIKCENEIMSVYGQGVENEYDLPEFDSLREYMESKIKEFDEILVKAKSNKSEPDYKIMDDATNCHGIGVKGYIVFRLR